MSRRGSSGGARGRGRGRRRSDSSVEDQETCRRKWTEKSHLKLCDYAPTCSKGEACPRAHNDRELQLWQNTLCETIREFPKGGVLKICRNATSTCVKGLKCNHAHSQAELESWSEALECRGSSGKVMEMCKNKDKDCSYGEDCRYAHNAKELKSWICDHESNYLTSPKSKPEMCTFTVNPPPCRLGANCPFAHSKPEREKLIEKLVDYDRSQPRPVPRKGKLVPYTLCKNESIDRKNVDGECIYGVMCPQAHSVEELQDWEQQRKDGSVSIAGLSQHQTGCDTLLGSLEGFTETNSTTDASDNDRSSDNIFADPFLVSLEDFQHHFGHQLSIAFNLFISAAKKDLPTELGGYISHDRTRIDISTSEGQEDASMFDLQYQLGFMQRNASTLAAYVDMEGLEFSDVTLDLLEVRNSLAHGLNKRASYGEKCELTVKYFGVAIALVEKMRSKIEMKKFDSCLSKLLRLECNMSEFLQYEDRKKAEDYALTKVSHQQRAERAKEALAHLTTLVEEESRHENKWEVTDYVTLCLAPRLKKLAAMP